MALYLHAAGRPAGVRPRVRTALDTIFAGLGHGFNAYVDARTRVNEMERLNAMTDTQLAAIGLRRNDIARHVFRDKLHM